LLLPWPITHTPFDAQQQRAAVLGVVEPLLDPAQVVDQESGAHLAAAAPGQFFLDHIEQHAAHRSPGI
jgi:hypothetical protein